MVTTLSMSSPKFLQQTNDIQPNVRLYTKSPGTAYLLPSDEEERTRSVPSQSFFYDIEFDVGRDRLTRQHALINRVFGGLLHAPVKLTDEDIVLESATGTGK